MNLLWKEGREKLMGTREWRIGEKAMGNREWKIGEKAMGNREWKIGRKRIKKEPGLHYQN
ncbi:hypothetical protein ASF92_06025 [Pedobacter sp. Leaf176]|nr:hypothetical protein ASF92_06025 [Pedobacter sp. Leaf176]